MPRSVQSKPTTVLIVEDEAIVRLELTTQLNEMGYIALAAGDADQAIALLDRHPEISILVTDIRMPGSMDGLRLAHHVRHRWPPIRIIVVSGLLDTELSQLPVDSIFLSKPNAPEDLAQALLYMTGGANPHAGGARTLRA